jgi:hypothetical protein
LGESPLLQRLRRRQPTGKFVGGGQLKQKHRQFDLLSANTNAAA